MNGPDYCLPAPTNPPSPVMYQADTDIFVQRIERRERKPILWITCGNVSIQQSTLEIWNIIINTIETSRNQFLIANIQKYEDIKHSHDNMSLYSNKS